MNNQRYFILSFLVIIAQMVLVNYMDLSVFITLSFLPVIIMMAPSFKTIPMMILAFAFGFVFNFFADGMLGLASAALLPVALLRKNILSIVFQNDLSDRDAITVHKYGLARPLLAILICNTIYFCFLVPIEAAGTREPAFLFIKILLSTIVSSLASLIVLNIYNLRA